MYRLLTPIVLVLFLMSLVLSSCNKEPVIGLNVGDKAPEYLDYENHDGTTSSSSDFLGQYVYIDLWATTCFPCAFQVVELENMKEIYKDKNIAFVSISLDTNHDKWRDVVTLDEMKKIQLLAPDSWKSEFIKECDINAIPRFILIDTKGIVVDPEAPFPTDKEQIAELFKDI